jgi:hypothetical protein
MDDEKTVRKSLEGKPDGWRTEGRHRIRWMDAVEQDLMNMGVKRFRTRAVDGTKWVSIVREAMANI